MIFWVAQQDEYHKKNMKRRCTVNKDKNGQNRGGARVPEVPYRKVRLEFWDIFTKLVDANHLLVKRCDELNSIQYSYYKDNKDLKEQLEILQTEYTDLREDYGDLSQRLNGKGN